MPIIKTTIRHFADEMSQSAMSLLDQLHSAGINKSGEHDFLTEHDKTCLLKFLLQQREQSHVVPKGVNKDNLSPILPEKSHPVPQPPLSAAENSKAETKKVANPADSSAISLSEYLWPGQYKPFDHQIVTSSFLTMHPRAYCLNDMGTGKTLSVLWAYDYLKSIGQVNRMLVTSPLSTLEETWGNTIFRNFPHLTFSVLHGSRDRRKKLLDQKVDIYIINHDGVKILCDEIANRDDINVVVIDEIAQVARNKSTDRWKALRKIVPHPARRCWGLTGAPTPNAPTDAWAQCLLVTPDTVPKYMGLFKDSTMKQVGYQKWVPKPGATEFVANAMQPSIRYKRDECIDLPPVTHETRSVELTADQRDAYRQMLITLAAKIGEIQISAIDEAAKVMKLVQIACGAVYGNDGETAFIPASNRLAVVEEIIEQAGSKVIVFVPFTGALEAVAEHLAKSYTVEKIQGSVSRNERDRIFQDFQNTENPRVLVAQASAMSHGLTLTAASVIVWFAPVNSLETYEQACARITRPGQKLKQLIVNIEGSPVEKIMYERLQTRGKMQGLLLELLKNMRMQIPEKLIRLESVSNLELKESKKLTPAELEKRKQIFHKMVFNSYPAGKTSD